MFQSILYIVGFILTLVSQIGVSNLVAYMQMTIWVYHLAQSVWEKMRASPSDNNDDDNADLPEVTIKLEVNGKVSAASLALLTQFLAELESNQGSLPHRP